MSERAAPFEEALVLCARGGDRVALERLMLVCRPDLLRYARRHCEAEDVDEAVQDALWALYRHLGALRTVAAFGGWLFQVVRRACLGHAKRRPRHRALDALPPGAERDPNASDPELRAIIAATMAALPPVYREAIVLKDVQGLSADEVAATLGVSIDAAKSRLHRARAMVRPELAGHEVDRWRSAA